MSHASAASQPSLFLNAAITAGVGCILCELLLPPQFKSLLPGLGGMALILVAVLNTVLLNFPLSMSSGYWVASRIPDAKPDQGMLAGILFLSVWLLLALFLFLASLLSPFSQAAYAVLVTLQRASTMFGWRLFLFAIAVVVLNLGVCALGGWTGYALGQLMNKGDGAEKATGVDLEPGTEAARAKNKSARRK